jgi:hypothetical protein
MKNVTELSGEIMSDWEWARGHKCDDLSGVVRDIGGFTQTKNICTEIRRGARYIIWINQWTRKLCKISCFEKTKQKKISKNFTKQ